MAGEVTGPRIHLVDQNGHDRGATPAVVAALVEQGTFFWLDLEAPEDDLLATYCESLQISEAVDLDESRARSAFALASDCAKAVLPAAVDQESTAWLDAHYVSVVLTGRYLFTAHTDPSAALDRVRQAYLALDSADARSDPPRALFLVLDGLLGSFMPQLLALDDRLGEIQLGMLEKAPRGVHDELVQILGILTDGIQELGWYAHDLDEVAEAVGRVPKVWSDADEHLSRHRQRVARMRESGKEIREEAKNGLAQYSEAVAGRQAQVLSSLTIVATVFLPLSFITGYFGMNFTTLTAHLQVQLWQFLLLGLALPIASAVLSVSLIHRLERRYGIGGRGGPIR